jgi:hypothetical protein
MKYEVFDDVSNESGDELILGRSSWDNGADTSLKYAWRDKNGKRARGGELSISALRQAARFAAREAYLPRDEVAGLAKDLVDILAATE